MTIVRCLALLLISLVWQSQAQTLHDPTKPPNLREAIADEVPEGEGVAQDEEGKQRIPAAKISAIFVSDASRYAIIDNATVFEGEMWKNVLVAKVNRDSVVLKSKDVQKEIKINTINIIKESQYVF